MIPLLRHLLSSQFYRSHTRQPCTKTDSAERIFFSFSFYTFFFLYLSLSLFFFFLLRFVSFSLSGVQKHLFSSLLTTCCLVSSLLLVFQSKIISSNFYCSMFYHLSSHLLELLSYNLRYKQSIDSTECIALLRYIIYFFRL